MHSDIFSPSQSCLFEVHPCEGRILLHPLNGPPRLNGRAQECLYRRSSQTTLSHLQAPIDAFHGAPSCRNLRLRLVCSELRSTCFFPTSTIHPERRRMQSLLLRSLYLDFPMSGSSPFSRRLACFFAFPFRYFFFLWIYSRSFLWPAFVFPWIAMYELFVPCEIMPPPHLFPCNNLLRPVLSVRCSMKVASFEFLSLFGTSGCGCQDPTLSLSLFSSWWFFSAFFCEQGGLSSFRLSLDAIVPPPAEGEVVLRVRLLLALKYPFPFFGATWSRSYLLTLNVLDVTTFTDGFFVASAGSSMRLPGSLSSPCPPLDWL